jgi:hypothetical protein
MHFLSLYIMAHHSLYQAHPQEDDIIHVKRWHVCQKVKHGERGRLPYFPARGDVPGKQLHSSRLH